MRSARLMIVSLIVVLGVVLAALAQSPQTRGLGQATKAAAAAGTAGTPAARSQTPASAPQAKGQAAPGAGERRDPFISTIQVDKAGKIPMPECPPGVRGIIIGQAELVGVVETPAGMIAVITTSTTGRTYFLREDAPLCNGRVVRITPDSIVFEENVIDLSGKAEKREVIKKIPAEAI